MGHALRALVLAFLFGVLLPIPLRGQNCGCDGSVPTHTVDLTNTPDTSWSVFDTRDGYCCSASGATRCIKFEVSLHPDANQLSFDVQNPSPPGGAFYQVNCGPEIPLDSQLCVQDTASPFCITYCKSGNDNAEYIISSSQGYGNSGKTSVRQGCTDSLYVQGMNESTIDWTSVYPDADGTYDSYLSCQDSCDTTLVSPPNGAPDTIRYEVSGELSGCSGSTFKDTIPVYTFPGMTVDIVPDTAYVCPGDSDATLEAEVSGGAPPYTYDWSNGSTDSTMTDGVGDYQVSVTDTTDACPAVTDSGFIRALDSVPTPTPSSNSPVCEGDSIKLRSDSLSGVSYHWYGPNGFTSSSQDTNILNAALSDSGTYHVYATKGQCTSDTNSVTVDVNPKPSTPTAGSNAPLCGGDTLELTATTISGANYSWSGPNGFSSTQQNPIRPDVVQADSGYYEVSVTVNGCASDTDSVFVSISPQPSKPTASSNSPVCVGDTIDLSATNIADADYYWNGPNGYSSTQQNPSIPNASLSDSGLYTVYVVDTTTGCDSDKDSVVVDVDSSEFAYAGPDDTACANVSSVAVSGSTSTGTGSWSTLGDGSFADPSKLSTDYFPGPNDSANGGVDLVLSSTNNGACGASSDTMSLILKALPVANAGPDDTVCANNADVSLNGSVSNASGGHWISSGDGTFDDDSSLTTIYHAGPNDTANGSVDLSLITTGNNYCPADTSTLTVTITDAPVVDAGSDQSVCKKADSVDLNGSVSAGSSTGQWSTLGDGSFDDPNDLTTDYVPGTNDTSSGSVQLVLTSTNNGDCNPVTDTMLIDFFAPPKADAGNDTTVCANNDTITLNGSSTTGSGQWSTSGSGTFADASSLNTSYYPSDADTANGSVTLTLATTNNGTCAGDTDSMTATITDAPHPYAGPDDTVCANNATVGLNGDVYVASGGVWSTTGDGTFADSTNLSTTYTAGPNDTANGSVQLILTSTGNGGCYPESDTMVLTITDAPVVDAGSDQNICKTQDSTTLNGSVSGPTNTGEWSTLGDGTFDDVNDLNTDYYPGSNDTANGFVDLVLTSTNNGDCNPVTDTMRIKFTAPPVVDPGNDTTVCANNDTVTLKGSSSTGSGQWSTSGSGTFADASSLNTSYYPSDADTANGSVTLTLVSTNNGTCDPDTGSMTVTITDAPHPYAGPDDTVCANNATASLNGDVYVASGGVWSTTGDGTFADSTNLSTTYTAGPNDTANGSVQLILTSTGNGDCYAESDTMELTIHDAPIVDAGSDQLVCKTQDSTTLNGSVSGPTSTGQWSTLGDGTFDDVNDLNTDYYPGSNDTANGFVDLVLTSTNNGDCNPVTDTMRIEFFDGPKADAGPDDTVCANSDTVALDGYSNTGSGAWFTSGSGTFADPTDTNTTYDASDADTANGSVVLSLETTNNGSCEGDTSSMTLTITDAPHPYAGKDDTVCANNATDSLHGEVYVASSGVWSTGGDGSFSDSTSLNTTYTAGPNDTANGSVELYLTTTGNGSCNPVTDTTVLTITDAPNVDAGSDMIMCLTSNSITLNGTVNGGASTGKWSTTGDGTFDDPSVLNTDYYWGNNDTATGYVDLVLTSTNNGDCFAESDTVRLEFIYPPKADAGNDTTLCSNNDTLALNGSSSTGSGEWFTSGSGTFADPTSLKTLYDPSDADTANGSVTISLKTTKNGNCDPDTSSFTLTLTDAPHPDAGKDDTVCANNATDSLHGEVYVASGGTWSTAGDGSFSDSTSLNTTYTAGPNDTANGSVELYLTTTGNGNCYAVTDTMLLTITDAPSVDAGPDTTYSCLASPTVSLSGTSSTGSGQWSTSGSGTFQPSNTDLNADYDPSSTDTANGSVDLVLQSTNNGGCLAVYDTIHVEFVESPTVDAGNDTSLCANNDDLPLDGKVSGGSSTGEWSTSGSGTFSPNDSTLDATYMPSDSDTAAASVDLILTATKACEAVSDTLTLTITDAPVADAGPDMVRCKNNLDATLSGDVYGGSSTGVWDAINGSGSFSPDSTALNATYSPSSSDTAQGYVDLVLTTTNNQSNCLPDKDTMRITYTEQPVADAGADQVVCADHDVDLNGSIDGGSGEGEWSTPNGTGSFLPSDTALKGSYSFSAADTANGSVTLVLSSVNNGNCNPDTDTMKVTINPAPVADAGNDTSLCANNDTLQLNGDVSVASGGEWSTTGDGSFTPHDSTLTASYVPGPADEDSGSVTLILSTTGNGNCYAHHDSLELTLTQAPQVDAGSPIYICEGDTTADLNGSVSGATNTGIWSSSGTGSFDPSNTALKGTYQMSDADTAAGSVWLTLTSTNNGNCYAESDSVKVTVTTAATVSAASDTTLCTDVLDSLSLNGTVNGGSNKGEWSTNGFGSFSPSDTVKDPSYVFDTQDTSMKQITLSFASVAACVNDTDSVTVDLIDAPTADAGPDISLCEGQQAALNGTVINAWGGVWSSSGSGSFIPDDSTLTADYVPSNSDIDSGSVSLYLSTYGGNAAQCGNAQDSLQLTIDPQPVAVFSMNNPCVGDDLGLSDSSYVAGDSIVSHQWVIGTDTLNGPSPSYSLSDTGSYTIRLVVTSSSGCEDTATRSVDADPQPNAAFSSERLCDQEVQFTDGSSVNSGSINDRNWSFGDGDSSSVEDPLHSYGDTGIYGVTLTVQTDSGCKASTGDSIRILPDPIAEFEPRGGKYDPGETISFKAYPKDAVAYLWDFGNGNSSTDSVPEHFYEKKGTYDVKLVVEDSLGCKDSVTYTFSIGKVDEVKPVAVPSAFTPNGDGENDVFRVLGGPMKKMDFRVYNEWGNELFVSKKQSKGWDGTANGKKQAAGSYIYILKGRTVGGKKIEKKGKVHLIR